jgi:hypothetical protein
MLVRELLAYRTTQSARQCYAGLGFSYQGTGSLAGYTWNAIPGVQVQ